VEKKKTINEEVFNFQDAQEKDVYLFGPFASHSMPSPIFQCLHNNNNHQAIPFKV
jgi:hypothetical protein